MIALIPQPRSLRVHDSEGVEVPETWRVIGGRAATRLAIEWLESEHVARRAPAVSPPHASAANSERESTIRFEERSSTPSRSPESYTLRLSRNGVTIGASAPAGYFYAAETLLQLFEGRSPGGVVPCLEIDDAPSFEWRGMHLDVCRHFFPVDFICHYLDICARYKINRFHWHLTEDQGWRIEIPDYPRLTEIGSRRHNDPKGGYYSRSDVEQVLQHAADRCIEVVPEIELPGHCRAALAAYPHLSCRGDSLPVETEWGIFEDIFCAGREETFQFLNGVLECVTEQFPGRYVHLGGDECPADRWLECSRCQTRMVEQGLASAAELHRWFVQRVGEAVARGGKRWIGWDEICDAGTPESAIVMSWRGSAGGLAAARSGHDAILAPTDHCYFDYRQSDDDSEPGRIGVLPWERVHQFRPRPEDFPVELRQHLLGIQGNVWTEGMKSGSDVEYMILPRLPVLAEVAWSDRDERDDADLRQRLVRHQRSWTQLGLAHRAVTEPTGGRKIR